jgi:hypothetical protein
MLCKHMFITPVHTTPWFVGECGGAIARPGVWQVGSQCRLEIRSLCLLDYLVVVPRCANPFHYAGQSFLVQRPVDPGSWGVGPDPWSCARGNIQETGKLLRLDEQRWRTGFSASSILLILLLLQQFAVLITRMENLQYIIMYVLNTFAQSSIMIMLVR